MHFEQDKMKQFKYGFTISYYHIGSYSKESPFLGLEQSINYSVFEKIQIGLGSGINVYPSTFTFPIISSITYSLPISSNWNCSILQSYGRNMKFKKNGFKSNRYFGQLSFKHPIKKNIQISPSIGYLYNWDKWGGQSLSFTIGIGLHI